MAIKIQLRRGTAAEWSSSNPVLMQGEMGVETDTLKVKLGNGSTAWNALPYFTQGSKGDTGPANTITMGTVTTGAAGSSASATVTGTAPNQVLNLVIPRGNTGAQGIQGEPGPANTITIGTVTGGATASATITGASPNQTLNLVLPKGDTGATGAQGPAGATGATGPANSLSIGTVASGATASATITGTAPSQTLNLVLPKGDTGATGATGATGPVASPNYIINGGFDVWQRGTTMGTLWTADRWYMVGSGTVTNSRSTDVPNDSGLTYSLSVAQTSGTYPSIQTRLEGAHSVAFAGKTVTLSFWAKSTTGAQGIGLQVLFPNGFDNWSANTLDYSATITPSMSVGSWTRYTATWTASANAKNGYQIYLYRDVPSNDNSTTLYTGIQLEQGATASVFRRNANSIQGELAACQRYYYRQSGIGRYGTGFGISGTTAMVQIQIPVTMRSAPSSVEWNSVIWYDGVGGGPITSIGLDTSSRNTAALFVNAASGLSAYRPVGFASADGVSTAYIGFSAEL